MRNKIKDLTYMSICLSLLIVCSKISFSIGPIPLTLQTFSVILISLILKWKKAFLVFLIYIIIGLCGIPVFSTGGGFDYIFRPSFGFILGFLLSSLVCGLYSSKYKFINYFKGILGLLIIDFTGLIYMYFIMNYYLDLGKSIAYIIDVGLTPFLIKDIISVILAVTVYERIKISITDDLKLNTKKKNAPIN